MHCLPSILLQKPVGMRLLSEAEDLVPLLLPDDRMAVPGERQAVGPAERLELFVIGPRTFLLNEADPVRETSLFGLLKTCLSMTHSIFVH